MIITNNQLKAFQQVIDNKQGFIDYMLSHLKKHFPVQSGLLQDEGLSNFINAGMEHARLWEFGTRYQCCLFIDVMVMLGSGFDSDIQIPWFREILNDGAKGPDEKIDLLYQKVMTYLDTVVGKGWVFPMKQLEKLANMPVNKNPGEKAEAVLEQDLLPELLNFWPQKYHVSGKINLQQQVISGISKAAGYGFTAENSIAYFVLLQYLFGHHIDIDPLYPWVKEFLGGAAEYPEEKKYLLLQELVKEKLLEGIQDEMSLF
jgi:hypothetical protein